MSININIKNKKELKRFYRLLPLYKSILFKFTKFKIEKDKYGIKPIIIALNKKRRKDRITYIYDTACDIVDDFYKGKNLCNFINNKCIIQQHKNCGINGCCRTCRYQSTKGCTTKNLACKLFTCYPIEKKYKIIKFKDLKILKLLSLRQRTLLNSDYFSTKEQVIMDLYIGSFVISTLRMSIRLIINTIYVKRRIYEQKR